MIPGFLTPPCCDGPRLSMRVSWFSSSPSTSPPSSPPGSPSTPARYDPDMEDMVSVLMWECCEWDEAMDITDWTRLLLTGSGRQMETHITLWLWGGKIFSDACQVRFHHLNIPK